MGALIRVLGNLGLSNHTKEKGERNLFLENKSLLENEFCGNGLFFIFIVWFKN
jgi:hypothetical protein